MKIVLTILFSFFTVVAFAQQPVINSLSPTNIEVGQTVTISGSNLNASGSVFFGGVESTNLTNVVSGSIIEAEVPAGATHGPITYINATSDLIAQSSQLFYISYNGSTINTNDTESLHPTSETDANDICLCDLNDDRLNDVIIAHSVNTSTKREITVFENQSDQSNTTFDRSTNVTITNGGNNADNLSGFIAIACADLDNDGFPDLAFTTNQGTNVRHIYIYRNETSAGDIVLTYQSTINLRLPNTSGGDNRVTRRIKAYDMDGDGKNDLIIGNDTDNTLHIFQNTSSGPGNFGFASVTQINSGNDVSGNLDVADLDNDGKLDIITSAFRAQSQQSTSSVTILKNNSIIGNFSFSDAASVNNGTDRISDLGVADVDQDGFNDLIVTSGDAGRTRVYRNTTSGSTISFGTSVDAISSGSPFGIDLGDINGDGLVDVVAAFAAGNISIVPNTSTSGSISFGSAQIESTTSTTQYVCVGDLNGDAKPDIAYTHDIAANGPEGDLGVFMNRNCITPEITPQGTSFCQGEDFILNATKSSGATYDWSIVSGTGTITENGDNATFNITSTTPVQIEVEVTQNACVVSSQTTTYTIETGAVTNPPTIQVSSAGVLCAGEDVTLSTTASFDSYFWTLPNGATSTNSEIQLTSIESDDAGEYKLRVQNSGNCLSDEVTQVVEISEAPTLSVFNQDADNFCSDGLNDPTLEVSNITGLTYQWRRNGTDITGETGTSFQVDQSGNYSVLVTDGNGCSTETSAYTVIELQEPAASFDGPSETCVNFNTTFNATSTLATGFTPVHSWQIEDASNTVLATSSLDNIDFTFPSVGTYEVILTTSYNTNDVASCDDTETQVITVSAEPLITFTQTDGVEKCQGDAITVGISSPDAGTISSYQWLVRDAFDGDTISTSTATTIDATTPIGTDSVYVIVNLLTNIGCEASDSILVSNLLSDIDISSPDFDVITNDSVSLEDDNFIVLSAENVVSDIAWSPSSIIADTTLSTITVFPALPITIVTLSGIDANGCSVATTVTIELDNIRPRRTFSPNADGLGFDCWEILNTSELPGCKVYVFDSRGKNILVADSPFENNCVWDGNFNGSPVPEGLYYFVLQCDDANMSKSGSILLAR